LGFGALGGFVLVTPAINFRWGGGLCLPRGGNFVVWGVILLAFFFYVDYDCFFVYLVKRLPPLLCLVAPQRVF
ncbi:PLP-dependent aminotransferase family protein, partial [Salmonella enterica subsp. enterica serovar Infantis]